MLIQQSLPLSASPDAPCIWFEKEPVAFVFLTLLLCLYLQRKIKMCHPKQKQKLKLTSAKLFKMRNYLQSKLTDKYRVKFFVIPGIAARANLSLTQIIRMKLCLLSVGKNCPREHSHTWIQCSLFKNPVWSWTYCCDFQWWYSEVVKLVLERWSYENEVPSTICSVLYIVCVHVYK